MDTDEDQPHEETSGRNPSNLQDPPMEDFSDDEINAAARIVTMVSVVLSEESHK